MTDDTKNILITGATDGVGRMVAERLATPGNNIVVHGRDRLRGESVVRYIRSCGGKASFFHADFASLDEVRRMATAIMKEYSRLDVLINNAGIGVAGAYPGRTESHDGYELRFAVNYLAGFLLTRLLLPAICSTPGGRIVNVASAGQQVIDFDDIMLTRHYSGPRAYCQSKLAQILFTFDLAQELGNRGVTVNALHPATYMDTSMVRGDGVSPLSSVSEGAEAILNLAVSPRTKNQTGLYFDGLVPSHPHSQALDSCARARLKALSMRLTGLQETGAEI
ncbi:SDR family NAD(P)-dependent oxidoreductase [Sodalis ligni]|uniref:NAD(P)-dependent dehydrogenase (Short-subunit alcohol dehydrogenase family) n=1 Tax=Sodalis ligni TaxID=2697027 RepID=A0A4R1NF79_9GAMM|nr:SDR family NAD(P)-dependent oxidoreductase [Sodalis ligni]TCL06295.1 NAD(P)-dependent dehydrogenase (short-subunit alcohol dehydrogenase family) [Sodalis ligni]